MLFYSGRCFAQSTFGSVVGTVQDATQAVVPGATVVLHSLDDNSDRSTISSATGDFQFVNLKPGHYSIVSRAAGFADAQVSAFDLTPRQTARINVVMNVQSAQQTVEVSATATMISTDKATLDSAKDNSAMVQLPLNSRASSSSPLATLSLLPNVQQDNQGNIALAGATANMVNYSVDGISTADVFHNGALKNAYPSMEGVAEVKATDFNNSAEFAQVGDVTFTTKGGSNVFHGSLFEYLQNDALDADVYGFGTKAPKRYNDFGGSLGGPVIIPHLYQGTDKTFFFIDFEGNRRSTSNPEYLLVPTVAQRQGNLNGLPIGSGGNGTLSNPLPAGYNCSGVPFTNNTIPSQCINPTALALLNHYYPLPTPGLDGATLGYNYQTLVPIPGSSNGFDARIDQNINSKQQIYARISWKNLVTNVFNQLLPDDADEEHDRSFLVSHNYAITPRLVNEFRFGFTHSLINPDFPIEGTQALNGLGFATGSAPGEINTTNHPTQGGFPAINFSDGTGFSTIGRDITGVLQSNTKQLTDNITLTKGRHTIRAGIDYRIVNYITPSLETASDDFGLFTFNQNVFTGSSFGDLLLGLPNTTYFAVTGPRDDGSANQFGFYGQDQWEINNHLTANAGVRYEYLPGFQDQIGNMANFLSATNTVVIPDRLQHGIGAVPAFLQSFNSCSLPGRNMSIPCSNFETASQAHVPQSLRQNYKYNFDPRIGIAYRPFSNSRTVIRAGFGVFTVTNLGPLAFNMSSNPTASVHTYQNNVNGAPQFQFPMVLTQSQSVQYGGGELEQGDAPNYRDPEIIQWNLTVEHEITSSTAARVSYVGMEGHRQNVTIDLNQVPENTEGYNVPAGGWVDPRAPFQNWSEIFQSANLGSTAYHSLQTEISHRLSHGLTFQADYSWTKSLSDVQGDAPNGFAIESYYGYAVSDRFHIPADRGNVEGTPRHRLLLTGTYELPFGTGRAWRSGNRFVNAVVGGWNVNSITLLQTGLWLTPTMSPALDTSGVGIAQRGTIARPDRVAGVSATPAHRSAAQYFNINAFTTDTAPGQTGNASVGSVEGPGTAAVAAGLAKEFTLRENMKMRFESTFTNVINRANFAIPATDVSNPSTFGVLTSVQTANNAGNRTGQVALRIDF
ncbi:TonB-dependent receptor [Acidipila sp. 4G-K13]|uniref:Carboxypeptidase regulatory-like domain-containing protein n=2 Tax=Paracidobacterium acidisoli TaxID=2303751 RepID=A0A372IST4_9BACT|nr:TonB-dependent receptor [Paracidobacterium acidisoli]